MFNYDSNKYADSLLFEVREEIEKLNEKKILVKQTETLNDQFNYDDSRLTLKQRRVLFKKYWVMYLKIIDLRSSQYYDDKPQCSSVSKIAWSEAAIYLDIEKLKLDYIESENLIKRLYKLKSSNNFESRKFCYFRISWRSSTLLKKKKNFEIILFNSDWLNKQLYEMINIKKHTERKSITRYHQ